MSDEFTIPSLQELDQTTVDTMTGLVQTRVAEAEPSIDPARPPQFDLLPYLNGLVCGAARTSAESLVAGSSLQGLSEGKLADNQDQANRVAKTFGVIRREATKASGTMLVVLDSATPFRVSTTEAWSSRGIEFFPTVSRAVRADTATVASVNDLALRQVGSGKWGVSIPVTAGETGAQANLPPGTQLSPTTAPTGFVKAVLVSGASGGTDQETDQSMAARALEASSIRTWAGRTSYEAIARASGSFSDLVAISVVGFGNDEQRRDKRGVTPISHGGRTDLWVKFRAGLFAQEVSVTASLTSKSGAVGTWSFALSYLAAPAVYRALYVVAEDDQSGRQYPIATDARSLAVPVGVIIPANSATRYVPDVQSALEAAYSAYENAVMTFDDLAFDVTSATIGTTRQYRVYVFHEPLVETLQQLLGSSGVVNQAGDVVVRSAVPCEVFATVEVTVPAGKSAPSEDDVAQATASAINASGFEGALTSASITAAVTAKIGEGFLTKVSVMTGRLRRPDGTFLSVSMVSGSLPAPNEADNMVTAKTVAFYCDPNNVAVAIT